MHQLVGNQQQTPDVSFWGLCLVVMASTPCNKHGQGLYGQQLTVGGNAGQMHCPSSGNRLL